MSELPMPQGQSLKNILEAALLAADEPLSMARLASLFPEDESPSNAELSKALEQLHEDCEDRGVELLEVASGWRLQVRNVLQPWVARLWTEKPQKYSRAMLETLSLIAYRQPITRGEIESVRGVSLSSNIIRSLQEREWVRIVGHRDVPGKPALFGTTKVFLDYFNLKSLDELPTLAEIKDMESLEPELAFDVSKDGEESASEDAATGTEDSQEQIGQDEDGSGDEYADDADSEDGAPDIGFDDEPVDDDELDEAFADLDKAFVQASSIDIGEDPPEADAGVDPDSPQGDLVADGAEPAEDEEPIAYSEAEESVSEPSDEPSDDESSDDEPHRDTPAS